MITKAIEEQITLDMLFEMLDKEKKQVENQSSVEDVEILKFDIVYPLMRTIMDELKDAYLNQTDRLRPFVIASSFGKDSSLTCALFWKMLLELSLEQRKRPVLIISSDTGLEHKKMREFVQRNISQMKKEATKQGLDSIIQIELVTPSPNSRFGVKVIGAGDAMPTPRSKRWCTDHLKIRPTNASINAVKKKHGVKTFNKATKGEVVVLTGVRRDESINRARTIKSRRTTGEYIFPKKNVQSGGLIKGWYECHPIDGLTDIEVWSILAGLKVMPWKVMYSEIKKLYKNSTECPLQLSEVSKQTCGTSRNGCVICLINKDDQMLKFYKTIGEDWANPIYELRSLMLRMNYDARYRVPINVRRLEALDKHNPFYEFKKKDREQMIKKFSSHQKDASKLQDIQEAKSRIPITEDEILEPLCHEGLPVYPDLALGKFSLEGRILLLKNTLYFQQLANLELVSEEDIRLIKERWIIDGWDENPDDLKPEYIPFDHTLELNQYYEVKLYSNKEGTTIPNLVINPQQDYTHSDADIKNIKVIDYKKGERVKGGRIKATSQETLINPTKPIEELTPDDLQFVFYVSRDWGGSEQEIADTLERAYHKTGKTIPYFWQPVYNQEGNKKVFWNVTTFIVCQPHIRTYNQALDYVETFIEKGIKEIPKEKPANWGNIFAHLLRGKSPEEAKLFLLQKGFEPEDVPVQTKTYAKVTEKELRISNIIHRSVENSPIQGRLSDGEIASVCQGSTWHATFYKILGFTGKSVTLDEKKKMKEYILKKGFPPNVVPKPIKNIIGVTDWELTWGNKLRKYGERESLLALTLVSKEDFDKLPEFVKEKISKLCDA